MNIFHNMHLLYHLGLIISKSALSESTPVLAEPIVPSLSRSIWHGKNLDSDGEIAKNTTVPDTSKHPHEGCKQMIKDQQPPQPMLVGKEFEENIGINFNLNYRVENEAGSTAATCNEENMAGGYPCRNVDLLSMIDTSNLNAVFENYATENNVQAPPPFCNDIWGWTHAQSGREFALVGMYGGTAFVEITDPYSPIYIGGLPGALNQVGGWSFWRDVKTMGDYAVVVSEETGHGMQIFDLTELLTTSETPMLFNMTAHYNAIGHAHNVFVNEEKKFAYIVGQDSCDGGLHIVNLRKPTQPFFVQCFSDDGYTHDVQCVVYDGPHEEYVGREICFASNENTITIIDVGSKGDLRLLSRTRYEQSYYTHQGWLTEDHSHFIFNDEQDEQLLEVRTRTHVMDVSNLTNPIYIGYSIGRNRAIDHNHYILDNFVYQANYRAGFNVLQIEDVTTAQFKQVGYFDIYPNDNKSQFNGAWSNYPFFPSGNIIVSGIEQGLFVLKFQKPPPTEQPSASPSAVPSSSPTISCVDSPLVLRWDTGKKTFPRKCRYLAKKPNRCHPYASRSHCPVTCGVCNRRFRCSDSSASFILNGNERTCEYFASLPKVKIAKKCKMEKLRETCRDLCGYCD